MADDISSLEQAQAPSTDVQYFKYKREQEGRCNICKKKARLYYDHVPPAACDNKEAVEVMSMFSNLTIKNPSEAKRIFLQNGVKYRTLCRPCNNNIGRKYDPALIALFRHISRCLRSPLIVPPKILVRTRPGAIYRSILGHLMAMRVDEEESLFDSNVRECVLDGNIPVPSNYHFHYWIYPYHRTIHMRDFVIGEIFESDSVNNVAFGQLLKFFPLAFWVVDGADIESPPELGQYHAVPPWEERELVIDLTHVRPINFPEAPEPNRITLLGSAAAGTAVARPRRRRHLL